MTDHRVGKFADRVLRMAEQYAVDGAPDRSARSAAPQPHHLRSTVTRELTRSAKRGGSAARARARI